MDSSCTSSSCFRGPLRSQDPPNDFRGDLHDLLARSLTADPGRTFPAKGHADVDVNLHQQLYCRLASQHSSTPISSWRPGPGSGNCQTLRTTAQAEPQHISAGPCSPFQALSQCQYVADRACSLPESAAKHRSLSPLPDLCSGLEDISGLTEPIASSLSCTTPNPYATMSSSSIDRCPSAPASSTQSLFATFASAASEDLLPSPSLSPPQTSPTRPAAPTEAENAASMSASTHMEVTMSLNVAPAAFSHPIRVNKAFSPAFRVSVSVSSQSPITWCVKVTAYLLTAAQVGNLQAWDPKSHSMPDSITGGTAEKLVTCNAVSQDGNAVSQDGPKIYQGSCRLTFHDMKFASSSGMRPRWLVFAMVLPSEDVMFVHYTAPTIIMSRSCGQCQKAAAILSGQDIAKKKRARSPARHGGGMLEGSLQHAPHTPGLTTEYGFVPSEHTAQLLGQLPQPAQISGITHQPAHIPGIMPQNFESQARFQSPTYTHVQQIPPCPSQLKPMNFAQPTLSHAAPVLTPAEEACLLRLGTQPMSQLSLVSSQKAPAQLPRKLPVQLPHLWDPTPSPVKLPPMSHLSPVSSQQLPAQLLLGRLPLPLPATRDPRKPLYCSTTVAATSSNPDEGFSSMGGLAYSSQQTQDCECVPPASPAQSALFTTLLLDSPDVNSSAEDAGNGPTQVSSPAGWNSPGPSALSHLSQQRPRSESPIAFLDALLNEDCGEADFALADGNCDFKLSHEDPDCAMMSEGMQLTGQHAQHDSMPPVTAANQEPLQAQSLSLRAPSSTFSSQTFPPPEAVSISRLQEQFPASGCSSSLHAVSPSTDEWRWPQFPPYTMCRWQMLVMQLYGDCHFVRKLTSQDIWILCQRAGFRSHPMTCDTETLCTEQWFRFGKWFVSQLHMLRRQQQHWDQCNPLVISGFEVNQVWCEDLLHGHMPGAFIIWHGMSQTACLTVSLVNERGSIEHVCLDSQHLAAHPLQVWLMRVHAAKMLVDSKTGQLWKKDQIFSPPPQVDDLGIRQTKRQTVLASDLLRASSCAVSANDPADPMRELQWSSFARAASLPGCMVSNVRRRKPRQQHSASRIVTSLSSVTDRHLREKGLSQVTGRFSH